MSKPFPMCDFLELLLLVFLVYSFGYAVGRAKRSNASKSTIDDAIGAAAISRAIAPVECAHEVIGYALLDESGHHIANSLASSSWTLRDARHSAFRSRSRFFDKGSVRELLVGCVVADDRPASEGGPL